VENVLLTATAESIHAPAAHPCINLMVININLDHLYSTACICHVTYCLYDNTSLLCPGCYNARTLQVEIN